MKANPTRAALILIDMENGFVEPAGAPPFGAKMPGANSERDPDGSRSPYFPGAPPLRRYARSMIRVATASQKRASCSTNSSVGRQARISSSNWIRLSTST